MEERQGVSGQPTRVHTREIGLNLMVASQPLLQSPVVAVAPKASHSQAERVPGER